MTAREFLQRLAVLDIRISANGDQLRVNAPQSVLTAELSAELAARKPEILSLLEISGRTRTSLIPIQPYGARPVLYGVPPDGDAFCYLPLSRQLGPSQPVFAFEAPGLEGAQAPLASIEALAAHYLADLRAFQPDGPYYISGYCLGGIVAFELARQIREQGEHVALLALIESPSPEGLRTCRSRISSFRRRRDEIFERGRKLAGQPWPARLAFLRSRLARALRRSDSTALVGSARGWQEEQKLNVHLAITAAAHTYVREVRPYPGRIVLFLGSQELKRRRAYLRQLEWANVAGGGLEVHVGLDSCTDYPMLLSDPPSVRALADHLTSYLECPPWPRA
jgi:thioesterase domain-containing protein